MTPRTLSAGMGVKEIEDSVDVATGALTTDLGAGDGGVVQERQGVDIRVLEDMEGCEQVTDLVRKVLAMVREEEEIRMLQLVGHRAERREEDSENRMPLVAAIALELQEGKEIHMQAGVGIQAELREQEAWIHMLLYDS
ncbi:MAG: hypothetical protein Q9201_001147 [Fulgogasparrea decipioides]